METEREVMEVETGLKIETLTTAGVERVSNNSERSSSRKGLMRETAAGRATAVGMRKMAAEWAREAGTRSRKGMRKMATEWVRETGTRSRKAMRTMAAE